MTDAIRAKIARMGEDDLRTGALCEHLQSTLSVEGEPLSAALAAQAAELARSYVEDIPELLERAAAAAARLGDPESLRPLLELAEQYFLEPDDLLPDELGTLGLLDDAYLCARLLELASDLYAQNTGSELLPFDLSTRNRVVAGLLGSPIADELDRHVARVVQERLHERLRQVLPRPWLTSEAQEGRLGSAFEERAAEFLARHGVSFSTAAERARGDGPQAA